MVTPVQVAWIRMLAGQGYGWEDISARLKRSGDAVPKDVVRAIVLGRTQNIVRSS